MFLLLFKISKLGILPQLKRLLGGCSQEVKAVGCDFIIRGFESRHSPT